MKRVNIYPKKTSLDVLYRRLWIMVSSKDPLAPNEGIFLSSAFYDGIYLFLKRLLSYDGSKVPTLEEHRNFVN